MRRVLKAFPCRILLKIRDLYVNMMVSAASDRNLNGLAAGYHGVAASRVYPPRDYGKNGAMFSCNSCWGWIGNQAMDSLLCREMLLPNSWWVLISCEQLISSREISLEIDGNVSDLLFRWQLEDEHTLCPSSHQISSCHKCLSSWKLRIPTKKRVVHVYVSSCTALLRNFCMYV